jgi:hypothetical protein
MQVPRQPPVGHLIAYEYLWQSQAAAREDGAKVYPAAIVLARKTVGSASIAYAVGISHKPPAAGERALEVPRKLKRWLGLDGGRSWAYTDQVNVFVWPGPDLRPADWLSSRPEARDTCVIGALPRDWFQTLLDHVAESHALKQARTVKRSG